MFRFRGPRYPPRFVSRSLRSRSRKVGGCLPGRGPCSAGDPIAGLLSRGRERDLPGSQAIHPVPLPRSTTPAESTIPRLFVGFVDATPAQTTAKASASWLYRGYRGASAPVAYASRMVLPPSMQGSLPAGWLAFTGRELNPLDRDEGFQITSSSSLPGLFLAQQPTPFGSSNRSYSPTAARTVPRMRSALFEACPGVPFNPAGLDDPRCPGNARQ